MSLPMNNDPDRLLRMAAEEEGCVSARSPRFYDIDEVWDEEWDALLEGVDPE